MMDAMQGNKVSIWQQYASDDVDLLQQSAHGHQLKVGWSCGDRTVKKVEWHSQDVSEVCKGIDASQMLTAITTTQSITFKGSRLQECRHVSMSIQACTSAQSEQLNVYNQMNPKRCCVAPFIG